MKKVLLLVAAIIVHTSLLQAQVSIVLKPNGAEGKDAYLRSLSPTTNYGDHPDFSATAWTNGGNPVTVRGVIDFDLSTVPVGAVITSASLSLYSYNSNANGTHSTQSGSNQATLRRVTTPWNEFTVTWGNQPVATTSNQVILPPTTAAIQDYINIDVTALVQDMVNDPTNSHGFMMSLVTEQFYRRMLFASSDNPDAALHPELKINYYYTASISENAETLSFNVYPNPASDEITVDLNALPQTIEQVDLVNALGQTVKHVGVDSEVVTANITKVPNGIYFVKVQLEDGILMERVVIKHE